MSPHKDPGQVITDIQIKLGAVAILREEVMRIEALMAQVNLEAQASASIALGVEMGKLAMALAEGTFDLARVRDRSSHLVDGVLGVRPGSSEVVSGHLDEDAPVDPTMPTAIPGDDTKFQIYGVLIDTAHEDKIGEVIAKARHNVESSVGSISEYDGVFGKHVWRKNLYRAAYGYFCGELGVLMTDTSGPPEIGQRHPVRPVGLHFAVPTAGGVNARTDTCENDPPGQHRSSVDREYGDDPPSVMVSQPLSFEQFISEVPPDPSDLPDFPDQGAVDPDLEEIFGSASLSGFQPDLSSLSRSSGGSASLHHGDPDETDTSKPSGGVVRHGMGVNVKANAEVSRALQQAQAAAQ